MLMGKRERIGPTAHGIALMALPALDRRCDSLEPCALLRGCLR